MTSAIAPTSSTTAGDTQAVAIIADQVTVRYPRFTLGPATFAIGHGERCAVVGANGAGKSTLLSVLAGQLTPAGGCARIGGLAVPGALVAVRAAVAYVGERLLCCPWLTADQHFNLQSHFYSAWDTAVARETAAALGLTLDVPLSTLSRGNSLKVALCSAIAQRASVLLLDEPTAGLDPVARAEFLRLLSTEAARRAGMTIVFATHILEDLDDLGATRLIVLRDGAVSACSRDDEAPGTSMRTVAQRELMAGTEVRS